MVKANRSRTGIKRTRIRANNALTEIGELQAFVRKISFDKLRHGPVKEHGPRLQIISETIFKLLSTRWLTNPEVSVILRSQNIAQAGYHVRHKIGRAHV